MTKKKLTRLSHTILAEGEATGHKHEVHGTGVVLWKDAQGQMLLEVPSETEAILVHEEHAAQPIAPGWWERGLVREYDHFAEEARTVTD